MLCPTKEIKLSEEWFTWQKQTLKRINKDRSSKVLAEFLLNILYTLLLEALEESTHGFPKW